MDIYLVIHFPVTQNKMPAGRTKKITLKIYNKIYITRAFYIIIHSNNTLLREVNWIPKRKKTNKKGERNVNNLVSEKELKY